MHGRIEELRDLIVKETKIAYSRINDVTTPKGLQLHVELRKIENTAKADARKVLVKTAKAAGFDMEDDFWKEFGKNLCIPKKKWWNKRCGQLQKDMDALNKRKEAAEAKMREIKDTAFEKIALRPVGTDVVNPEYVDPYILDVVKKALQDLRAVKVK